MKKLWSDNKKKIILILMVVLLIPAIIYANGQEGALLEYKNKWLGSYETLRFDTADGDLDFGQYAKTDGGYYVRLKPKNESQFDWVEIPYDVSGLDLVVVVPNAHRYYDEFRNAAGNTVRRPSTEKKYWDTARIKSHPQPERIETVEKIPIFPEDEQPPSEHHSIAFDATSNSGARTSVSSYSWSHECTGADRLIVVGDSHLNESNDRTVTGITFNGDVLTSIRSDVKVVASRYYRTSLYYRIAPDIGGSYTVAVTLSNTVDQAGGGAISYTGAEQANQPDAHNGTGGTADPATITVTTVDDNSWVVSIFEQASGAPMTCDNTQRWKINDLHAGSDTGGPKTPAGDQVMSWNLMFSNDWAISAASFAPVAEEPPAGFNMWLIRDNKKGGKLSKR